MPTIILGYKCKLHPDAMKGLVPPTPPKNYTKEATIAAWVDEKERQFQAAAPFLKLTGQIEEIVAIDLAAQKIFATKKLSQKDGPWGIAFARWLLEARGHWSQFTDECGGLGNKGVDFFGFNLKPFFRVLGVECNTAGFEIPRGLWYAQDRCYDPYDMLVETEWRPMIPLEKVAARGGLTLRNYVPGEDAKNDTRVTMELLARFRLVPTTEIDGTRTLLASKAFSTQVLESAPEDATTPEPSPGESEAESGEVTPAKSDARGRRSGKKTTGKKKAVPSS